jgi:iron complex transport system substrate-binding protein
MRISREILTVLGLCIILSSIAASAADFALEIYGNANMDDTIDEQDIAYVQDVIHGVKPAANFTDANHDGKIDEQDIEQIKQIINGSEKSLAFIDGDGKIATVHKPLNKIIATYYTEVAAIRTIGAKDKIVGVDEYITSDYPTLFPVLCKLPCVGSHKELDIEEIVKLKPDAVFLGPQSWGNQGLEKQLNNTGIDVVRLMPYNEETVRQDMLKLGYILDELDGAKKYLEWHDKWVNYIKDRTSGISKENRPKVFWNLPTGATGTVRCTATKGVDNPENNLIIDSGGVNIAADLKGGYASEVEIEWIISQNPDVIIGPSGSKKQGYETNNETSFKEYYDGLAKIPGFDRINAVKNGKVYTTTYIIQRVPWYPICLAYVAKWLHPDLFEDLDPELVHQEFIDIFCPGLDFDVKKNGIFVYPSTRNK